MSDHIKRLPDGTPYLGIHIHVDIWGASHLDDAKFVEEAMKKACEACGATILNTFTHKFGDGGGISTNVTLSESHATIHSWPENGDATLDFYMCGSCDPADAIPVLVKAFQPEEMVMQRFVRGVRPKRLSDID